MNFVSVVGRKNEHHQKQLSLKYRLRFASSFECAAATATKIARVTTAAATTEVTAVSS